MAAAISAAFCTQKDLIRRAPEGEIVIGRRWVSCDGQRRPIHRHAEQHGKIADLVVAQVDGLEKRIRMGGIQFSDRRQIRDRIVGKIEYAVSGFMACILDALQAGDPHA